MTEEIVARSGETGKGAMVGCPGTISVPSFTEPGKSYEVSPVAGYCQCPRYVYTGECEKHVALAEALVAARRERAEDTPTLRRIREERVVGLCRRLFALAKTPSRRVSYRETYRLMHEVCACSDSTHAMIERACRLHRDVLHGVSGEQGAS